MKNMLIFYLTVISQPEFYATAWQTVIAMQGQADSMLSPSRALTGSKSAGGRAQSATALCKAIQ
jgi:hypothetical protein